MLPVCSSGDGEYNSFIEKMRYNPELMSRRCLIDTLSCLFVLGYACVQLVECVHPEGLTLSGDVDLSVCRMGFEPEQW